MSTESPDWRPVADRAALEARAVLMASLRAFFAERGVLEVSTPLLSEATIPDPAIPAMSASTVSGPRWLHTSPEFPMKRLLAAGSGDIYQVCPVFRDGERGPWHNPEFTLLEWYRLDYDEYQLAREAAELINRLLADGRDDSGGEPFELEYVSYREAFLRHAQIDPLTASDEAVAEAAIAALGTGGPMDWSRADWLDLLGSTRVYPALGRGCITALMDFPADQAALARLKPGEPAVAARFELFLDGIELANGFRELADPEEQRHRFAAENRQREARGLARVPVDRHLLAALEAGLPDCAGIALGLDRLLALALGAQGIDAVLAFPWERA